MNLKLPLSSTQAATQSYSHSSRPTALTNNSCCWWEEGKRAELLRDDALICRYIICMYVCVHNAVNNGTCSSDMII